VSNVQGRVCEAFGVTDALAGVGAITATLLGQAPRASQSGRSATQTRWSCSTHSRGLGRREARSERGCAWLCPMQDRVVRVEMQSLLQTAWSAHKFERLEQAIGAVCTHRLEHLYQ
jgi:hypothetical protein